MKNVIIYSSLLYAAALLLFTGCSKLQGTVMPITSTTHSPSVNSYLPVTKGSYWEYKVTANGVTDTSITTMTGQMSIYDAQTWYEASTTFKSHKFPDGIIYFSDDVHTYNKLTINCPDTVEQYYFNDTTALNGIWTSKVNKSGYINGQQARFVGQIVEQNINLTVNGTTYTGVSHSKVYLQYSLGDNNYTTVETDDFFMVRGIGPIEIFTATSAGITSSQSLIGYAIK